MQFKNCNRHRIEVYRYNDKALFLKNKKPWFKSQFKKNGSEVIMIYESN